MKLLLRLFPRDVRERHGEEMLESLRGSDRRRRDALDLVRAALRLRLDRAHADGRVVYSLGAGLIAATASGALLCGCPVLGSMAVAGAAGLGVLGAQRASQEAW